MGKLGTHWFCRQDTSMHRQQPRTERRSGIPDTLAGVWGKPSTAEGNGRVNNCSSESVLSFSVPEGFALTVPLGYPFIQDLVLRPSHLQRWQ